jgi:unsaturated rhamnogalacturonyl hydrolase
LSSAKFQFLLHIQYLTDNTTGLWYHGWEFTPTGTSVSGYKDTTSSATGKKVGHNFAKALWARGNCWVTIAIPLFIQLLEEWSVKKGVRTGVMEDPLVKRLVGSYRRQVDGLIGLQNKETGLWNTLLVDESSYEESSATAGFAAGIYMGLRMVRLLSSSLIVRMLIRCLAKQGLIEGEPYLSTANLALAGVIENIRPDCQLEKVSFGTGMGHDEEHYRKIPITPMPYGPALASLALIEWERLVLEKKK